MEDVNPKMEVARRRVVWSIFDGDENLLGGKGHLGEYESWTETFELLFR